MTTTPTIWKRGFFVNSGTAGNQTVPQTISLKNGNILVVWEDDTYGPSPFTDVMGQIFDPEGNPVGNAFQVNAGVTASDETGPEIVALPDGGYVVAYGGYSDADGGFIVVQRFNSNNQAVSERFITDAQSSLTDWKLSADSAGNYTVVFERLAGSSIDIRSITYNYSNNAANPERISVAQNTHDAHDRLGATAQFADGRLVTFYTEPDDWQFSLFPPLQVPGTTFEFTIINPLTGIAVRFPTEIAEPETREAGRAQDVAILTGGQIVLLYSISRNGGKLAMKIVADGSANGSISSEMVIDPNFNLEGDGGRGFENARAVALQDGGFLVAWVSGVFLFASRYEASGALIGSQQLVDQQLATGQTALFDLSLTGDGRVLIPFIKNTGEIAQAILDPRDNVIIGTDAAEVLTTQTTSTQIFGLGGNDTILGQDGADRLDGGAGQDTLDGGAGNDTYILRDVTLISVVPRRIFFDTVVEGVGEGTDTVEVEYAAFGAFGVSGYTLAANVENGIIRGTAAFNLFGNALNNQLTGNFAANILEGLGGNDVLDGGLGDDTLNGGADNDTYAVDSSNDVVVEAAGGGTDVVYSFAATFTLSANVESLVLVAGNANLNGIGNSADDYIFGNAGANYINGAGGLDMMVGGAGNDTYTVDNSSDGVSELVNGASTDAGGIDVVYATVDYALSSFVEALILTGSAVYGIGNAGANTIHGTAGGNIIEGKGGNDTVYGGGSTDYFAFYATPGTGFEVDYIGDFTAGAGAGHDVIAFSSSLFANYNQMIQHASQQGAHVMIQYDANNTVIILNAALTSMPAQDFLFV